MGAQLTNRLSELNDILKAKDDEILQLGKKLMGVDNSLDDTNEKLLKAGLSFDEAEKQRKILENKSMQNDERIDSLDQNIGVATTVAIESSRKCEEAQRKLAMVQVDLERTLGKADEAEKNIQDLEDELKVVGQNMKTLELSETEALNREEKYEETIRSTTGSLKMAEILAAHNEREAAKMQKELDNVKEELEEWKTKYDEICVELEQPFNSMAGY